MRIRDRAFGDIRAFTPNEVARMQTEINRVQSVIAMEQSDLSSSKWNPLNYVLGTQRDAITRMENTITQNQHVLNQLIATRYSTIESGDTDKLDEWFNLAAIVGDAADLAIWRQQVGFSKTSETVGTVAAETGEDVAAAAKSPFGIPWWVYVGGAGLAWLALRRK